MVRPYLSAAQYEWALPFYDPASKILGLDSARRELVLRARIGPKSRILDIGCGTGTLGVILKSRHPDIEMIGLDPDPKILRRAQRKARRAHATLDLIRGFSDTIPLPDESVDTVFSSFMFHHLERHEKSNTLRALVRVLRPGGNLLLLDFARVKFGQEGFWARLWAPTARLKDNNEERIIALLHEAGFDKPAVIRRCNLTFRISEGAIYQASAPSR